MLKNRKGKRSHWIESFGPITREEEVPTLARTRHERDQNLLTLEMLREIVYPELAKGIRMNKNVEKLIRVPKKRRR